MAGHVIIKHRRWCYQRLVSVPEKPGLEFHVDLRTSRVDRFREGDAVLRAAGQIHYGELWQPVFPFDQDIEILENLDVRKHYVRPHWDNFFPVVLARIGDRSAYQPESAALIVGANEELVAAVVGIIFNVLLAWRNQLPLAAGSRCIKIARFRGSMAVGKNKEVFAVGGVGY